MITAHFGLENPTLLLSLRLKRLGSGTSLKILMNSDVAVALVLWLGLISLCFLPILQVLDDLSSIGPSYYSFVHYLRH